MVKATAVTRTTTFPTRSEHEGHHLRLCFLCACSINRCDSMFQEMQLPMLKVSAPELVSGVSGESEQKLRELFDLAVVSSAFLFLISF